MRGVSSLHRISFKGLGNLYALLKAQRSTSSYLHAVSVYIMCILSRAQVAHGEAYRTGLLVRQQPH